METVLRGLAEGLVDAGDEVTVLCAAERGRGATETLGGVTVVRSASLGKWFSQPMTPLLPASLARLCRGADVVHVHMPNPLAEMATASVALGVPTVVTYHADILRQRMLWPVFAPVRQAILAKSRRVIVPTENHIRHSTVLARLRDKCVVVPFGISPERYVLDDAARARAAELRRRHGNFVLFVGRLVHYKGLPTLVEAMRSVEAQLVIVGDGPLRHEAEAAIDQFGLRDRVTLVGAAAQADLNAYLEACSVLTLPSVSRAENFGMILLEGMLFGKPLVTTRLPSGVGVVNADGETGFQVEPRDARALAAALNRLLGDDDLRARMGAASRARLESHFSLERMIAGHRQVYREALR
jgi:rhamnosyl/mannosyltransferase